ncbi:antirestriction Ral family protein [Escherichia coli]|uniref:antirestriction Ral family protein n=1 Tax=Escherichia coli TaxID=562 RepID=UPI000CE1A200|nr:antirestriction Ral family protein [Escherichia coli]PPA54174.1 restriction endonuclease [Escherichia coli]PQP27133.1 restriction endonuclease [Escherichia coli]
MSSQIKHSPGNPGRFNGCKLQSECMVKPEEMFPVMEDGKYVDKWAIRTTAMIARELGKQNNKAA